MSIILTTRKNSFFVLLFWLVIGTASASTTVQGKPLLISTSERQVTVTQFSEYETVKRPSVLLLHGYRCIEECSDVFQRYAQALVDRGINAYVVNYYSEDDSKLVNGAGLSGPGYSLRFKAWTRVVNETANVIAMQPWSDGRVALIGFSQGGWLAIASAANNARIAALVVFYARLPHADEIHEEIRRLPPALILHGSADTIVPISDGNAVFAKAQALGNFAGMVVYADAGHGFDFALRGAAAEDARRQVLFFLRGRLSGVE